MSKAITIYMDEKTLSLLDKVAETEARSRSNMVRKLLNDYIENENKLTD